MDAGAQHLLSLAQAKGYAFGDCRPAGVSSDLSVSRPRERRAGERHGRSSGAPGPLGREGAGVEAQWADAGFVRRTRGHRRCGRGACSLERRRARGGAQLRLRRRASSRCGPRRPLQLGRWRWSFTSGRNCFSASAVTSARSSSVRLWRRFGDGRAEPVARGPNPPGARADGHAEGL